MPLVALVSSFSGIVMRWLRLGHLNYEVRNLEGRALGATSWLRTLVPPNEKHFRYSQVQLRDAVLK